MHAPHHVAPGVGRALPGRLRPGLGRAGARRCSTARSPRGVVPEGTILTERPAVGPGLGRPVGRRTADAGAPAGGLRRLPHPHRRRRSAGCSSSLERLGSSDDTLRHGLLRQRRQRRGRQGRQRQRAPLHRAPPRVGRRQPGRTTTTGAASRTYNHYSWAWAWAGQHAAQALEALHLAGRDPHAADRPLARPHRGARRVRGRSSPTSSTSCRRSWPRPAWSPPMTVDGVRPAATWTGSASCPRSRTRSARSPPDAVLRDAGLALHLPRRLEGDDRPHQHRRARRGGAGGREPRLRPRTAGSSSTSTTDFSEVDRPVRGRAGAGRAHVADLWTAEAERNHVLPISDGLVDRFSGFIPPAWPAGRHADVPARGWAGARRVRPAAVGRLPP